MQYTASQATSFLQKHYGDPNIHASTLGAGEWSQAFAFSSDGKSLVLRLGSHKTDFIKDQNAFRYSSDSLPIAKVLEVGEATIGNFAISERVFGKMIDSLNADQIKTLVPSIFATFDAIRTADLSSSRGYGMAGTDGDAPFASWKDYLLDITNDPSPDPGRRINGWRTLMQSSSAGDQPFNEAYEILTRIVGGCPDVRYLVHNDFLNNNVLVSGNKISGVIDWANALYGDFLYDLSRFVFWAYNYPALRNIDWKAEAKQHYESIGLDVPHFEQRLAACQIHMGLQAQTFYAFTKRWDLLGSVGARTLKLARSRTRR